MIIYIQTIQYHVNGDPLAVLCEDEYGLANFYINLAQSDMPAAVWDDEHVLAAAQAKLDTDPNKEFPKLGKRGHVLMLKPRDPEPVVIGAAPAQPLLASPSVGTSDSAAPQDASASPASAGAQP